MEKPNEFYILSEYDLIGLSTEDKPTNVKNASTYLEVDTSKSFIFYKGTWYEISRSSGT